MDLKNKGKKPEETCFFIDAYLCEGGVNGAEEQIWDASAVGGLGSNEPVTTGFTLLDDCGLLAHEVAPDTVQVNTSAATTNINDNPPDNTPDQHILTFTVKVPNGGAIISARSGGIHAGAFAIGPCQGKLEEAGQYQAPEDADVVTANASPGLYDVKAWVHDPTQNGTIIMRWSLDGGQTFVDIPDDVIYTVAPKVTHEKLIYNKETGEYSRLDGTVLDTELVEISCYNPCAGSVSVTVAGGSIELEGEAPQVKCEVVKDKALTGEVTKFKRWTVLDETGTPVSFYDTDLLDPTVAYTPGDNLASCYEDRKLETFYTTVLTVTDAAPVLLNLTDVDGNGEYCRPVCATIQVQGGQIRATVHGGEPNNDDCVGRLLNDCSTFKIGDVDGTGCALELEKFQAIALPGETVKLFVEFQREKL